MTDSKRFVWCGDAIVRQWSDGAWLLSNPRVRQHVQIEPEGAPAIMARAADGANVEEWIAALSAVVVRPRTAFTNAVGLLADPSGVATSVGAPVSGAAAFAALRAAWLICEKGGADYAEFLGPRQSLLDSAHQGTFHQNVGRHLLLDLRLRQTWRWWHDQKFESDGLAVRSGPYQYVQQYFFDAYFNRQNLRNLRILDFACGNGFYSRRFRNLGAQVVGIDTSAELIEIAKGNHGDSVEFLQPPDGAASDALLDALPPSSFDRIYLSDALLFFFHDPQTSQSDDAAALRLFGRFRRLLKPSGLLYLMEPNGAFWLAGHAGTPERPAAVVTEYREQIYHVAPTIDRVISALGRCRLAVVDLIHPQADPLAPASPMSGYARRFPLWDFYVCRSMDSGAE